MLNHDNAVALLNSRPLKTLEPAELGIALQAAALACDGEAGADLMRKSIMWATVAHAGQTRAARGKHEVTAYIEHPLRCALRLHRMGVRDINTLCASVMHDTVEDGAQQLVALSGDLGYQSRLVGHGGNPAYEYDVLERSFAIDALATHFNDEIAHGVQSVTNPLPAPVQPGQARVKLNQQAKTRIYVSHLRGSLTDERSTVMKFTDYADNAGSLHHTPMLKNIEAKADKYLSAHDVLAERIEWYVTSDVTRELMLTSMDKIQTRLESVLARHARVDRAMQRFEQDHSSTDFDLGD